MNESSKVFGELNLAHGKCRCGRTLEPERKARGLHTCERCIELVAANRRRGEQRARARKWRTCGQCGSTFERKERFCALCGPGAES